MPEVGPGVTSEETTGQVADAAEEAGASFAVEPCLTDGVVFSCGFDNFVGNRFLLLLGEFDAFEDGSFLVVAFDFGSVGWCS